MMREGTLMIWDKGKVNFGNLPSIPCVLDKDYRFCPITFKLHILVVHD